MKENRRSTGTEKELLAARYLTALGYHILGHQYYTRHGEIDLIYEQNGILIFGEVKYRSSSVFGTGAESVDYRKRCHLQAASRVYLTEHQLDPCQVRFDVIEIIRIQEKEYIRLLADAFRPGE